MPRKVVSPRCQRKLWESMKKDVVQNLVYDANVYAEDEEEFQMYKKRAARIKDPDVIVGIAQDAYWSRAKFERFIGKLPECTSDDVGLLLKSARERLTKLEWDAFKEEMKQ